MAATIQNLIDDLLDAARSAGVAASNASLVSGAGPYTLAQLHRAILFILDDFVRETRCTRQIDSLVLTASASTVSFSTIAGFDPERIIGSGIRVVADSNYSSSDCRVADGIKVVGPEELADAMLECGTGVGVPTLLTFDSFTAGFPSAATVWHTPQYTGTAKVEWTPPLQTYNAGVLATLSPGDTLVSGYTTNVRDDMAHKAVRTGGVVYLQNGKIENIPMTNPLKADYVAHVNASRGRGNLGVTSIQRDSISMRRRRGWW